MAPRLIRISLVLACAGILCLAAAAIFGGLLWNMHRVYGGVDPSPDLCPGINYSFDQPMEGNYQCGPTPDMVEAWKLETGYSHTILVTGLTGIGLLLGAAILWRRAHR